MEGFASRGVPLAKALYRRPVIGLASAWRGLLAGTVFVGITGSVGKTTTKDLAFRALGRRARVARSHLSNNDLYNTARTLLATSPGTRYCLQEVGVDAPGSIDAQIALLRPQVAVVTAIGLDHYSAFGSREAVALEKSKLVLALGADGIAVLNADDPHVEAMAEGCVGRVVRYGRAPQADLRILASRAAWPGGLELQVAWRDEEAQLATALRGAHHEGSLAAALALALCCGSSLRQACEDLGGAEPTDGRLSLVEGADGVRWLRDDYKTSMWSVGRAFDYLAGCRDGVARRVIVLGSIADRPRKSRRDYGAAIRHAARCADVVLLVGEPAQYAAAATGAATGAQVLGFPTPEPAARWLAAELRAGDLVLLKGGRRDHLGRLLFARDRTVACWRTRCERMTECSDCAWIGVPTRHDGTAA